MYNLSTFLLSAKNSICGLKKGTDKMMYIEHNFENAHLKLAKGKPIKKFPKRGQSMKINICGHVMVRKFLNYNYAALNQAGNLTYATLKNWIIPNTPVAQKVADEVVFRRFEGEGAEFFLNRISLTHP